jgi:phosphotransferase system enzyme I (PtsI)
MSNKKEIKEFYLSGSPGCPGIVIGNTSKYQRKRPNVSDRQVEDDHVQQHVEKFREARQEAKKELKKLWKDSKDDNASELVRTQIEMLDDPELSERVEYEITVNNKAADTAIKTVFDDYLQVIKTNFDDDVGPDRSIDISDVRDRLIQIIHDHQDEFVEETILLAHELSPREVIEFTSRNIKGIIMDRGGTTSHAAIIARSMGIPAVVGLKNATEVINSNEPVILDGRNGEVIVHPQESTQKKYQELIDQEIKTQTDFEAICEQPNRTSDGKPFSLQANIEFAEELSAVKKFRVEGIGLLRTESIYLSRENFSDQKQQEVFYESILELTEPHPVTIRLFDAGGDKFFEEGEKEQNPFLGWRGIRMLLDEKVLLKNQLTAILKAAAKFKNRVRILVPMISTLEEVYEVKELMLKVQGELIKKGIVFDEEVQLGIMVEVPSVALQADIFAQHADFLSIGTNDLTQYVLAVDRGNVRISTLYDQRHPAIWQLIKQIADAADENNTPLSVCGELASDPIAACCLLGLGINSLSMNPVVLPTVKQMLRGHSLSEMQQLSKKVLASNTISDINQIFSNWKTKNNY